MSNHESQNGRRTIARYLGYFLVMVFFGLTKTWQGFNIMYGPPFSRSTSGELYLWLGHALLLVPASCLIGYGFAPTVASAIERLNARVASLSRRERALALAALVLMTISLARLGHYVVNRDYPVTDDENACQFGGRVLASGRLAIPATLPPETFPNLFLYYRGGYISSFDFPGAQAAWAIAEVTHLGPFFFAILAALPVLCLALVVGERLGPKWGLAAAALFLASPMALLLSFTTHTHVVSRGLLALALLLYLRAVHSDHFRDWVLTGFVIGLGALCRPAEVSALVAPLLVVLFVDAVRGVPKRRAAILGIALGGSITLAVLLVHTTATTGNPFLPARFAATEGPPEPWERHETDGRAFTDRLWERFGANSSYNIFMLAVWFLGPLGIALVALGTDTDRFTRCLTAGVGVAIMMGLLHDDHGIHNVGPIHYSESAVPLTIVASHGLANVLAFLRRHRIDTRPAAAMVAVCLALGLQIFTLINATALRDSAFIQEYYYDTLEATLKPSAASRVVVLAPRFSALWINAAPQFREIGGWVFAWRKPNPALDDDMLILHDAAGTLPALRAAFPERRFYRIEPSLSPPFLVITSIE